MRAKCSICQELFTAETAISAISCGHTFHDACIQQWMHSGKAQTCPHCRTKIDKKKLVNKLYFDTDISDDETEVDDTGLRNQISNLKGELIQQSHEKKLVVEEKYKAIEDLAKSRDKERILEQKIAKQYSQLQVYKREAQDSAEQVQRAVAAQQEAVNLRKKLLELKDVQNLLTGCQDDVEEMVRQSSNLRQVAEWVCVYKKELTSKKEECRRLKKREMDLRSRQLDFRDLEIKLAKSKEEQAKQKSAFKNYSEKISDLENILAKRAELQASILDRSQPNENHGLPKKRQSYNQESNAKKPKLLALSPSEVLKACNRGNSDTRTVAECASRRTNDIASIAQCSIMQKRRLGESHRLVQRGYNGMGSHSKHTAPMPRPSNLNIPRRCKNVKLLDKNEQPQLPTLDGYVNLE